MKYICTILSFAFSSYAFAQLPMPSSGRIIRYENFKSKYVMPRNVDVWVPDNYDPAKKYAVLYMHDGQMLFDSTVTWNRQEWMVDETLTKLMNEKKIRDCIVVGIWNNGQYRTAEYLPQKPIAALSDSIKDKIIHDVLDKPMADAYLLFLTMELKPFIDSAYSTLSDQSNTFIAGSSKGGLISLYAICEYPNVFGAAACLSTHWPGLMTQNSEYPKAFNQYLVQNLPSPNNHKIYFDFGTATLDAMYEQWQEMIDQTMMEKGYSEKNWMTKKFPGADHSEHSWQKRFNIPMEFLLK